MIDLQSPGEGSRIPAILENRIGLKPVRKSLCTARSWQDTYMNTREEVKATFMGQYGRGLSPSLNPFTIWVSIYQGIVDILYNVSEGEKDDKKKYQSSLRYETGSICLLTLS